MTVQRTCWVIPVAFALLPTLLGGTNLARADDVVPPSLTYLESASQGVPSGLELHGLLTQGIPRPGEHGRRRLRRWVCDVDGQVNGVCTFGRRCRPSRLLAQGVESLTFRCRVTVPVPVGERRRQGPVTLVCAPGSSQIPCGPTLSCDTASEVCVAGVQGGPGLFHACEPVPTGCEADRSCRCVGASLCQRPSDTCTDNGPNSIACVCLPCA
jgi:hypothetical protein